MICLGFLLLFTSQNSCENMIGQIYQQQGYSYLGNICLFTVYSLFTLCSLFSPLLVKKTSYKYSIFASFWGYIIFMFSGVILCSCKYNPNLFYCNRPTIVTISIGCSALLGFAASVVWPSASAYISEEAGSVENKQLYFSLFSSFYMGSQISAKMLTVLILQYFGHMTYFLILLGLAILSSLCILVIKNIRFQAQQVDTNTGINDQSHQQISFKEMMIAVGNRMQYWEIKQIGVYYFASGYCMGFYNTFLYRVVQNTIKSQNLSDEQINVKTGICYVFIGLVQVLLGFLFKQILKLIPLYPMQRLSNYIAILYLITLVIAQYYENYSLCIVTAIMIGVYSFQALTIINLIISDEFSKQFEIENFVIFKVFQSCGVVISIALIIVLDQFQYSEYMFMWASFVFYLYVVIVIDQFTSRMQKNKPSSTVQHQYEMKLI